MPRLAFVLAFLFSSAAAADKSAVAVLDIQGTGVDDKLLPTLTEVLTVEVDNLGAYKVVGGRDVQAMLGFEKQKDMLGCTDAACLAEIGGALGVDRIVVSHIGMVGKTYVVNIKLINIRMADTEARVYETVNADRVDNLIDTVRRSVVKLLGPGSKAAIALGVSPAATPPATTVPPKSTPTEPPKVATAAPRPDVPPPTTTPVKEPAPQVTATAEGGGVGWLPITLWSVGGAALVGSLGLGILAKVREGDSKSMENPDAGIYSIGAQASGDQAKDAALWSNILLGASVLTAGTGVLVWLLSGDDAPATALAPVLGPASAGVVLSGSF
jgi:hypothetical protein